MKKNDSILFGIALGVGIPLLVGALSKYVLEAIAGGATYDPSDPPMIRTRTVYLLGICANVFIVNYFKKYKMDFALRGVVIATAVLGILWAVRFGPEIFADN